MARIYLPSCDFYTPPPTQLSCGSVSEWKIEDRRTWPSCYEFVLCSGNIFRQTIAPSISSFRPLHWHSLLLTTDVLFSLMKPQNFTQQTQHGEVQRRRSFVTEAELVLDKVGDPSHSLFRMAFNDLPTCDLQIAVWTQSNGKGHISQKHTLHSFPTDFGHMFRLFLLTLPACWAATAQSV